VKVSVCCEYPNRTPRTSAVVFQCSHIPVALSPCYRFCFSALHTSQTPASISALPLTYENTKFSSIDDKVKQMMANQDEALAAHELAQTRMADRRQNTFTPFTIGQKVWLDT
jgi:hypothetical protein